MNGLIEQHRDAIRALCQQYGVRRLDLFGSAATGCVDPATSDLDFVATFANTRSPGYADRYLGFAEAFRRRCSAVLVDFITERSIRNRLLSSLSRRGLAAAAPSYDERDAILAAA